MFWVVLIIGVIIAISNYIKEETERRYRQRMNPRKPNMTQKEWDEWFLKELEYTNRKLRNETEKKLRKYK